MEKTKMKTLLIAIAALLIGAGIACVFIGNDSGSISSTESAIQQYTCGMHPEIISDEPGYCPICGMKLTPKKAGGANLAEGPISIDPTTVQNMGIVTETVTGRALSKSVRASGKIEYSEPSIQAVNVKVSGWVEEIYIDYEGQFVKAGQPLLKLYSPELVAAQREYLVALKNNERMSSAKNANLTFTNQLLDASVSRLQNWDISNEQIRNLESTGKLAKSMVIRSPYDGVVISKNAKLGDHLKAGTEAYRIADISEVWAVAYIYEKDLLFVSPGQRAEIELPYMPGETFTAKVAYISPYLDKNHQVEIRLNIHNTDFKLKPDMYAEVSIQTKMQGKRVTIPLKAVINSGAKQLVYVSSSDGVYQPRLVRTGATGGNDYVEVVSGLSEGERVVVSGQFMLDSESRLNESLTFTHEHDHSDDDKSSGRESHDGHTGHDISRMKNDDSSPSGIYTCPISEHYHVLQYGEGKCSECGMNLVSVEKTDNIEFYHCPMSQCRIVSDKPGDCPVCGMHLKKYEPRQNND